MVVKHLVYNPNVNGKTLPICLLSKKNIFICKNYPQISDELFVFLVLQMMM